MDIEILKNIFLIFVIIVLIYLISTNQHYNQILTKNKFNYLILIIIIYFVYIDAPLIIIVILLLACLVLNKYFYNKYLKQNKYLKDLLPNIESFENNDEVDFIPYETKDENKEENNQEQNEENKFLNNKKLEESPKQEVEPFKERVQEIRNFLNNAINNTN
mgnify:CR=1 FL=1